MLAPVMISSSFINEILGDEDFFLFFFWGGGVTNT